MPSSLELEKLSLVIHPHQVSLNSVDSMEPVMEEVVVVVEKETTRESVGTLSPFC